MHLFCAKLKELLWKRRHDSFRCYQSYRTVLFYKSTSLKTLKYLALCYGGKCNIQALTTWLWYCVSKVFVSYWRETLLLSSSYLRRRVIPLEGTDSRRQEDLSLQHLFISGVLCTCSIIWLWKCFPNTGLDAEIQKAPPCATLAPKITEELGITVM